MVINVTDEQIKKAKAVIDELSKILGNTEKESQVTNITSLAAYQTLLDIEKNNNEKLKAENERLMARNDELNALNKSASIEAAKEFVKCFEKKIKDVKFTLGQTWEIQNALKDTLKEMVGDDNA